MLTDRPPSAVTARVLMLGTALSAALLTLAFVGGLARIESLADMLSTAGVVALLATPAVGLATIFIELRPTQRRAALLALAVLAVLGISTVVALLTR